MSEGVQGPERLAALLRQAQQEAPGHVSNVNPYYGHAVAEWLLAHGVSVDAPRPEPSNSLAPLVAALREPVTDLAAREFRLNLEACLAREDPYAYHHALEQFVRDALAVRP